MCQHHGCRWIRDLSCMSLHASNFNQINNASRSPLQVLSPSRRLISTIQVLSHARHLVSCSPLQVVSPARRLVSTVTFSITGIVTCPSSNIYHTGTVTCPSSSIVFSITGSVTCPSSNIYRHVLHYRCRHLPVI